MKLLNKKNFINFLLLTIFTLTVTIFGINDIEEYQVGTFSTLIFWESFSNLFTFFYDFYGPGTKLPIGPGPLFHPLNIFLNDLKIYYTIFTLFHLYIQLEYTKKLFKLFKIDYDSNLLTLLLVFSLPNIFFGISADWISAFFSYCLFPVIFYYLVKIIEQKDKLSYYKFSLFFCFWIINGNLGHISTYIIFLICYLFLSIKSTKQLKNIINFSFLISLIFIALILSEYIFYIIRELSYFDGWKRFQSSYDLKNFIEIFYPNKRSSFGLNRLPGNPILIYFSLSIVIVSILNFINSLKKIKIKYLLQESIKLFFKKTQTDVNFKFCFLFFLFLIFSLLPFLSIVPSVSGAYMARDMFIYSGLFIYFINYKSLKNKIKLLLNSLLIIYSLLFFCINIYDKIIVNENNFILDKYKNTEFIQSLKSLNLSKNDYQRVYLSPNLYKDIWEGYEDDGIFAVTDLIKFNLAPFTGYFKQVSMKNFGDETKKMDGWIRSHYNFINDEFFLNIFKINFLLIEEDEINYLKNNNFKLIKKIKTAKNDLFLLKRNVVNYSIRNEHLPILIKKLKNCKVRTLVSGMWVNSDSKLDCLLRNKVLFDNSTHKLTRISNGNFSITNTIPNHYPVLPFVYDSNWKSDNNNIINSDDFLILLNTENLKKKQTIISYKDDTRYVLNILSLISFSLLFLTIILKKKTI